MENLLNIKTFLHITVAGSELSPKVHSSLFHHGELQLTTGARTTEAAASGTEREPVLWVAELFHPPGSPRDTMEQNLAWTVTGEEQTSN